MKLRQLCLGLGIIASSLVLSSCGLRGLGPDSDYWLTGFGYDGYEDHDEQGRKRYYRPIKEERGYHLSQGSSPTSHKKRDRGWIHSQNQNHYTIEIDTNEKASHVAKKLYQSPKSQRSAQFKHKVNGKKVYTGVHGSFATREEAEAAMKNLPGEVRGTAKVRTWGGVQYEASTPVAPSPSAPSIMPMQ